MIDINGKEIPYVAPAVDAFGSGRYVICDGKGNCWNPDKQKWRPVRYTFGCEKNAENALKKLLKEGTK